MAKCIMVQGTMSNVGKSLLAAGLCRVFAKDGYSVAPFKSQNMALNSYITHDGKEMGRAQVLQAQAAGVAPDVRMNPVLLKPTGFMGSQVIVNGTAIGTLPAKEYYRMKHTLIPEVKKAYDSLAAEYDIIVIEGAGSPAEINLQKDDFVNMGLAAMLDAPVLLVGDIDRGGVFAQLAGTYQLLSEEDRARIKGLIINKFRGDVSILTPGLDMLKPYVPVPFLGVVPHMQLELEEEDSQGRILDEQQAAAEIDIAVIRLPYMSNYTDFDAFRHCPGVSVRFVTKPEQLQAAAMICLPGSKNTIADLDWLRQNGLAEKLTELAADGKLIFGICGGFQMLGQAISDPQGMENADCPETTGLGLLAHTTVLAHEKELSQTTGTLGQIKGSLQTLSGCHYEGYEIHLGRSLVAGEVPPVLLGDGTVYGTYLHGFFDHQEILTAVIHSLARRCGFEYNEEILSQATFREQEFDKLEAMMRESLDMDAIYRLLEL
ncbi:MAG: cobyric acid synthase [Lachnospiraceae bacterium]|nr:cobyric acid synthase [Lachnospiraceae bacterium]MDY5741555.1 cobyric acid synthase [Lachnospiraceae bacterium]